MSRALFWFAHPEYGYLQSWERPPRLCAVDHHAYTGWDHVTTMLPASDEFRGTGAEVAAEAARLRAILADLLAVEPPPPASGGDEVMTPGNTRAMYGVHRGPELTDARVVAMLEEARQLMAEFRRLRTEALRHAISALEARLIPADDGGSSSSSPPKVRPSADAALDAASARTVALSDEAAAGSKNDGGGRQRPVARHDEL